MAEDMLSLLSLEDELTCSICLNAFENPVTLPCGHNFCQGCLDDSWNENILLSCPQCRHQYSSKPELKKNTVLSAVVEAIKTKSASESDHSKDVPDKQEAAVIKCDTCMEVKAFKTCLTCMASFCEEHVKPHQENPTFRAHQLIEPVGDLQERICNDHGKIMEFFCLKHECTICSTCLQQMHKGCDYTSPQERREKKESEIRGMLSLLDRKIDKNNIVLAQIRQQEFQLQDVADANKKQVSSEYQLMRDLIDRDEQDALRAVDKDLESGQSRLQSLSKMFGQNVDKMTAAKANLNSLLSRADSLAFLQASVQLPSNAKYDPYCPRMNPDSQTVTAYQSSAVSVKELLDKILSLPAENRISLLADFERGLDEASSDDSDTEEALDETCSDGAEAEVREMATPAPQGPSDRGHASGFSSPPGPCFYSPPPQVVHVMHYQPAHRPGPPSRPGGQKKTPAHPHKKPDHKPKGPKDQKSDKHHDKDKKPDHKPKGPKDQKSDKHHDKAKKPDTSKEHGKKAEKSGPPHYHGKDHGQKPHKAASDGKPSSKPCGPSRPASAHASTSRHGK